jgi:hypothetical protein
MDAPMLIIVEDAWFKTPLNIEVINMIRKTANVIPSSNAVNLDLSLTSSLYASLRIPFTVISFRLADQSSEKGSNKYRMCVTRESDAGHRAKASHDYFARFSGVYVLEGNRRSFGDADNVAERL